jgi:hypothetical protein
LRVIGLLVFLVLAIAVMPSHVSAAISFPHDGAKLTYLVTEMGNSSFGSIAAVTNDTYFFSKLGDSWNVTEILVGKISCSPNTGTLTVKYGTLSDIMGLNATALRSPNIFIQVSYIIKDRMVLSTPIGTNVPASYEATCNFGGIKEVLTGGGTPAPYASAFKYYVFTYIQPEGVSKGSTIPVAIMQATISGTQTVQALGRSWTALVGTIPGLISGTIYWESNSGILLLEKSTTGMGAGMQTEQMQLIESSDLAP